MKFRNTLSLVKTRSMIVVVNELAIAEVANTLDTQRTSLLAIFDAIEARPEAERLETAEETEQIATLNAQIEATSQTLNRLRRREELTNVTRNNSLGGAGTVVATVPPVAAQNAQAPAEPQVPDARVLPDNRYGYENFAEFVTDVRNAGQPGGMASERLQSIQANHAIAEIKQNIGFRIPPAFDVTNGCDGCLMPSDPNFSPVMPGPTMLPFQQFGEDPAGALHAALVGGATSLPAGADHIQLPMAYDKDFRGEDGSLFGGIHITEIADDECYSKLSKLKLDKLELKAGASYSLICFHERLLRNSTISLLALFQSQRARAKRLYDVEKMLRGSRTNHIKGILNKKTNPALIEVGRKNPQPGKCTITLDDLLRMIQHFYNYGSGIWVSSTDMMNELWKLQISLGSGNEIFTFTPGSSMGMLMGRPIYFDDNLMGCCELCLINPSQYYRSVLDSRFDSNPHLLWLCDKELFRITEYEMGAPNWDCPMVTRRCQKVKSPYVCLSETAEWHLPECPDLNGKDLRIYIDNCMSCSPSGAENSVTVATANVLAQASAPASADLQELAESDVRKLAENNGLEIDGKTKEQLITEIEAAQDLF